MFGEKIVAEAINDFFIRQRIDKWSRLIFQITVGAVTSFLCTSGTVILATVTATTQTPAWSLILLLGLGSGMLAAGVSIVRNVERSELTKGMLFTFSKEVSTAEVKSDSDVLQR